MKILFDSFVFLDLFLRQKGEASAEKYLKDAANGTITPVISSLCILEVKYHILRRGGEEKALDAIEFIKAMPEIEIIDASTEICELAASIRSKYYSNSRQLSLGDSVHIATAMKSGCDKIVTGDTDFKDLDEIRAEVY